MLLTEAGKTVLALADRVEAAIMDCQGALDLLAGRTGGTVHLGAVSTAKYFVPHAIGMFVNAGDPNFSAAPGELDLDGQPRVARGRTDLGAYDEISLSQRITISPIIPCRPMRWPSSGL